MKLVQLENPAPFCARLVLNRPDKLNALSQAMMTDFLEALEELAQSPVDTRVVIVGSSTPKALCAGADLSERLKMSTVEVGETLTRQRKILDQLAALPLPTIAVMEGIAFGFGLEMALACDLRLAAPDAQMGLTETRLAILPGAGGTQRLSRLVGPGRAKELIFTGRRLKGQEAMTLGLVNAVSEAPARLALEWAEEIAKGGPLGLRAAKKAIDHGLDLELRAGLDWERHCYEELMHSEDRLEGLRAFAEKRPPVYKGK